MERSLQSRAFFPAEPDLGVRLSGEIAWLRYAFAVVNGEPRGIPAGFKAGDTVVSGSAELRVPLTSPLSLGKFGVSAFVDAGTAYDNGQSFSQQTLDRGVGGGIWLTATAFRLTLDVAHGIGGATRVHFGTSLLF